MLTITDIHTYYDTSHVLFGVSMSIQPEEVVCLLGRNGAGKSTTLLSIMGVKPPHSGRIEFMGEDITGKRPYQINRAGIGIVPQERRIFSTLTVQENLTIATPKKNARWGLDDIYELFPVLERLRNRWGGLLSGGEQQMLSIGRTIMTDPKLLLLDEPGEGLSPLVVEDLGRGLRTLKDKGLTILVAEQNVNFACKVSQRAVVIDKGQIRYKGTIDDLVNDGEVKSRYLSV